MGRTKVKQKSIQNAKKDLSEMENEWPRLKKNYNPFKIQNQDLSEMENEWARLKQNSIPFKVQRQKKWKMNVQD